jgi:hypothetical protein
LTAVKLVELRVAGGNIPQFSKDFKQNGTSPADYSTAEHSKSSICTYILRAKN